MSDSFINGNLRPLPPSEIVRKPLPGGGPGVTPDCPPVVKDLEISKSHEKGKEKLFAEKTDEKRRIEKDAGEAQY